VSRTELRQNRAVTSTFPAARKGKPGYDADEVDEFLARARDAFSMTPGSSGYISSDEIRHTAFRLRRTGGYSARHVDAALERLEEAFATRERDLAIAQQGSDAFYLETRQIAQEIVDRLARPEGKRFSRVSVLTRGYHPADVDSLADRLSQYFQNGQVLTVETVRTIGFRSRRGGYTESQVDALLDTVIRLMLAVR
jgi:DivIVA domain-containing protein